MKDRYAVIGNPIAHSKSPKIHMAFAEQLQQEIEYEAILAPLDRFEDTVLGLIADGYKGVNITVPFKLEAYHFADRLAGGATHAGAVNTLSFSEGGVSGHNTDGIGLVCDIEQNLQRPIDGKRVLLLGAGGAAEGVLRPILEASPSQLIIANRTPEKALAMVNKVDSSVTKIEAKTFADLQNDAFDFVINATSAGLSDAVLPIPSRVFAKNCLAYDMMYGRETPFMKQARDAGATVADGLGMLVEQAAEAFYLWRGVRPKTQAVMQMLRNL